MCYCDVFDKKIQVKVVSKTRLDNLYIIKVKITRKDDYLPNGCVGVYCSSKDKEFENIY